MNKVSIKTKITFWYISLMMLLVLFFLGVIFYISENLILNSTYSELKQTVSSAFNELDFYNGELEIDSDMNVVINNVHISIYDENLQFIYGDQPLSFKYDDSFKGDGKIKIVKKGNKKWYVYEEKKNFKEYGDIWFRGIVPASEAEKAIEIIIFISLAVFPFLIFFIALSGYFITKNAFRPIEKIRMAAEKINEGNDLSQRINMGEGYDEIHTLANTFDTMFNRLQSSFNSEVQFTSDVSHELRTPISVIISQSEYGLGHLNTVEKTEKSLNIILQESKKMSRLISQLLTMSRIDRGHQKLNMEYLNVSEITEIVIDSQKNDADSKNIKILTEIAPEIYMRGDELMIMRLLINLISNAVSYGKENGCIKVRLLKKKGRIIGKISDNGIGIAKENIDKIWTRFFRVETSRTTDNSGLGLAMVKWIVEAHRGNILVESELGKGSTFTFILPDNLDFNTNEKNERIKNEK
ncbi:MAG: HAMP domain-containing sensor histidine kinase [Leptotrichiaceae bacterium]|nr:HAMP domain-containing sensor histidine kinase [Leptotrichiaceae bacterium]